LGGVNRSTTARNSAGLPLLPGGNTGISKSQSAGSVRISAWIHDLEAMDRFLLEQAAERRAPGVDPAVQQVVDARRATERSAAQSLEAIRLANQAEDDAAQRQLAGQLAKARELEEAGKPGVARIYYRMALKRATGPLRSAIATRLAEIDGARVVSGSE
jgi:phage protein D